MINEVTLYYDSRIRDLDSRENLGLLLDFRFPLDIVPDLGARHGATHSHDNQKHVTFVTETDQVRCSIGNACADGCYGLSARGRIACPQKHPYQHHEEKLEAPSYEKPRKKDRLSRSK